MIPTMKLNIALLILSRIATCAVLLPREEGLPGDSGVLSAEAPGFDKGSQSGTHVEPKLEEGSWGSSDEEGEVVGELEVEFEGEDNEEFEEGEEAEKVEEDVPCVEELNPDEDQNGPDPIFVEAEAFDEGPEIQVSLAASEVQAPEKAPEVEVHQIDDDSNMLFEPETEPKKQSNGQWPDFWCKKECHETYLLYEGCTKQGELIDESCVCSAHFRYKIDKCRSDGCEDYFSRTPYYQKLIGEYLEECKGKGDDFVDY